MEYHVQEINLKRSIHDVDTSDNLICESQGHSFIIKKSKGKSEIEGIDIKPSELTHFSDKNEITNEDLIYCYNNDLIDVKIVKGSIIEYNGDAIVNSIEPSIRGSLNIGITAELCKILGQSLVSKLDNFFDLKYIQKEGIFEMAFTTGHFSTGLVKFDTIFHCCFPGFNYINDQNEITYKNTIKKVIELANLYGLKSLGIPVIGCGLKKYPKKLVIRLLDKTIKDYISEFKCETLRSIRIIVNSEDTNLVNNFIGYFMSNPTNDAMVFSNSSPGFGLLPLNVASDEFSLVKDHFIKTMKVKYQFPITIKSIELVENNRSLKDMYNASKKSLASHQNKNQSYEYNLFHGSSLENILSICRTGFNRSYCGLNGTKYGNGVYFAREAWISHGYSKLAFKSDTSIGQNKTKAEYSMILAKVLVGTYQDYRQTNFKDTGYRPDGFQYDSAVDDIKNPIICVIYRDFRALPKYVIKYLC